MQSSPLEESFLARNDSTKEQEEVDWRRRFSKRSQSRWTLLGSIVTVGPPLLLDVDGHGVGLGKGELGDELGDLRVWIDGSLRIVWNCWNGNGTFVGLVVLAMFQEGSPLRIVYENSWEERKESASILVQIRTWRRDLLGLPMTMSKD
jgi:hypothetical protein